MDKNMLHHDISNMTHHILNMFVARKVLTNTEIEQAVECAKTSMLEVFNKNNIDAKPIIEKVCDSILRDIKNINVSDIKS